MKTMKMMSYCLVIVISLFASAEVVAQGMYSQQPVYNTQRVAYGAVAPSATFRSTGSTMMSTGSVYSAQPTIGTNGAAYIPGASSPARISGPRRVDTNNNGIDDEEEEDDEYGGNAGTPGGTVNAEDQLPLGDAVWPLMALACAYFIVRAMRRRREE